MSQYDNAADVASSSSATVNDSGAVAASGTPKTSSSNRHYSKSNKPLSAKQLNKIVKNLTSVQKSFGHLRSDSIGEVSSENFFDVGDGDGELGEDGERLNVSYIHAEHGDAADGMLNEEISRLNVDEDDDDVNDQQDGGAEIWLRHRGLSSVGKGKSKGPDGLTLARIAAKGLKGKENAHPESFLHEAEVIFNPLTRRVPHQTPRKKAQPYASTSPPPKQQGDLPSTSLRAPQSKSAKPLFATKPSATAGSSKDGAAELQPQPTSEPEPLDALPNDIQEVLIVEDLLHVLGGIEGQYIRYAPSYLPEDLGCRLRGAVFVVDEGLDASLRDLVYRILPLATHFTAIFAFAETESSLEFGTVVHALCAAVRQLLKEYEILIIQLEHQLATTANFTLQRLWFYVHPTLRTFSLLGHFLREIVNISHENVVQSDEDGEGDSSEDEEEEDEDDFDEDSFEQRRKHLLALENDDEDGGTANIVKGGEILSMLWDRLVNMGGDETAYKLFSTLFMRASQPYANILQRWITTGFLHDPYEEFLVMEDPSLTHASLASDPNGGFWERRYTLRDATVLEQREQRRQQGLDLEEALDDKSSRGVLTGGAKIPAFLEPWKRKILLAGKYLNVIRECGKDVSAIRDMEATSSTDDAEDEDSKDMTGEVFFQRIEAAYQRSNRALLNLLLDEYNIVERLRSMKHYFFQSQSDFFTSFIEAADRELRKSVVAGKVRDVTLMRLQSHLGMVLGSSSCVGYTDPFREDIRIELARETAFDHLKRISEVRGGIEAARAQAKLARQKEKERIPLMELLQFELAVKFPVSLVISRKNTHRWQLLQRPIIHLKSIERTLCDIWTEHQEHAWRRSERGHPQLDRWKRRVCIVRHRMLYFVQQMLSFITEDVLEPNWLDLEAKMERATTVDQFLKDHFDFLTLCHKECMWTDSRFVEALSRTVYVIVVFCENRVRFRDQLHMERANWQRDLLASAHQLQAPTLSEEVEAFLVKVESHWERRMKSLNSHVHRLSTSDNSAALSLMYRIGSA